VVRFLTCDQITTAAFSFMDGIDSKTLAFRQSNLSARFLNFAMSRSRLEAWNSEENLQPFCLF
jgi:hypothetical protein